MVFKSGTSSPSVGIKGISSIPDTVRGFSLVVLLDGIVGSNGSASDWVCPWSAGSCSSYVSSLNSSTAFSACSFSLLSSSNLNPSLYFCLLCISSSSFIFFSSSICFVASSVVFLFSSSSARNQSSASCANLWASSFLFFTSSSSFL